MQTRNLVNTLLLVALACLVVWSVAQSRPVAVAAAVPEQITTGSISVSGSSAIRVPPDRVVIVFGIETYAVTPRASQNQNARASRQVLDAIEAQGVNARDIATAHFTLQPKYDDTYLQRRIVGYWTQNSVAVTLRDIENLEPVMIAALEAGANSVDGVEFSVTNLRQLKDRARTMAVRAAVEKAEAMAAAADLTLGNVTGIHEGAGYYGYFGFWRNSRQWTNVQNVVQELAAEGAITLEDGSISLGRIVVQAQVSLTAELIGERR
jgi:uncharacterized protein YggE